MLLTFKSSNGPGVVPVCSHPFAIRRLSELRRQRNAPPSRAALLLSGMRGRHLNSPRCPPRCCIRLANPLLPFFVTAAKAFETHRLRSSRSPRKGAGADQVGKQLPHQSSASGMKHWRNPINSKCKMKSEAIMVGRLARRAQRDEHQVTAVWRTLQWSIVVILVTLLLGVLCLGVRVVQ